METKIIAMYLPQFHRVLENDLWWGEGYTEWTAVKNAMPLYPGHIQPREPLNCNYYDLLRKETLQWQAELMHKYGVYGQCFYHYYFKDGRKILEKPAENLLKWKDIDMPFCFSWANESWTRTWSKLSEDRNTWNDLVEPPKIDENDNGILLLQDYGEEKEWTEHFNYLLPFFMDERYIRIDGKPVFVLYSANTIYCLRDMVDCWNDLAIKAGLRGLYFVSTNRENSICDAELLSEPGYSVRRMLSNSYSDNTQGLAIKGDYKEVYKKCLQAYIPTGRKVFRGVFSGYDDTPRRGMGGMVIDNVSPSLFEDYVRESLISSKRIHSEFLFINAWNEWGEGMYLEPDVNNGYGYLEAVKRAIDTSDSIREEQVYKDNDSTDKMDLFIRKLEQYDSYWRIFDKWLLLKENSLSVDSFFEDNSYDNVAIYGLGMLGRHLLADISKKRVSYGIDGKADAIRMDFPIYSPKDELPETQIIVVTPTYDYEGIVNSLEGKIKCKIVSLGYIVDYVYNKKLIN